MNRIFCRLNRLRPYIVMSRSLSHRKFGGTSTLPWNLHPHHGCESVWRLAGGHSHLAESSTRWDLPGTGERALSGVTKYSLEGYIKAKPLDISNFVSCRCRYSPLRVPCQSLQVAASAYISGLETLSKWGEPSLDGCFSSAFKNSLNI
jgi:hypothetical protein